MAARCKARARAKRHRPLGRARSKSRLPCMRAPDFDGLPGLISMCSAAGDIRPFPLEGPWLGLSIARRRSPADGLVSAAPFHQHVTPPDDAEFGQPIEARYPPRQHLSGITHGHGSTRSIPARIRRTQPTLIRRNDRAAWPWLDFRNKQSGIHRRRGILGRSSREDGLADNVWIFG